MEDIYLFGSRARSDNKSDSDFDLYIMPGCVDTLTKLCRLLNELEKVLGAEVDIVSEGPHLNKGIIDTIFSDRKLIYSNRKRTNPQDRSLLRNE